MKKSITSFILIITLSIGIIIGIAPILAAAPITLKAITPYQPGDTTTDMFLKYIDEVNKTANNKLVIDFKGGPEVIPDREQAEAIRAGVANIGATTSGLVSSLVPEALSIYISNLNAQEQRNNGFYEAVNSYFKKANLFYLAFLGEGNKFAIFTNTKVENLSGLKGQMMRSTATYDGLFKALGCQVVSMPMGEIYSAMERNVVNGFAFPIASVVGVGLNEVVKTYIDHPIWNGAQLIIMNLKTWESLPIEMQKILLTVANKYEELAAEHWGKEIESVKANLKEKGINFVNFADKEKEQFYNIANTAGWDNFVKRAPDSASILKKYMKQ